MNEAPQQSGFPERRIRRSLRQRVLLVVVGLAIIPSAIILIATTLAAAGALRIYLLAESESRVYAVAEPLAGYIQGQVELVTGFSENQEIALLLREKFTQWESGAGRLNVTEYPQLGRLMVLHEEEEIFLLTRKGFVGRLTREGYGPVAESPSASSERALVETITARLDASSFAIEYPASDDAPPEFWICSRLADSAGAPRQAVWLAMPFDPVPTFQELKTRLGDEHMFLASSRSGVLGKDRGNEILHNLIEGHSSIMAQNNGFVEEEHEDVSGYTFFHVGAFMNLTRRSGTESSLVVLRPVETGTAMSALTYRVWQIVLIGLLFIAMIGVLGIWMANRLINPIKTLRAGFSRLERGDLDYRVEVRTGDELEELAHSMNRMADTLQSTYQNLADKLLELDEQAKQLTLTYRLSHAINRSLDIDSIFDVVCREVRQLMPAEVIALGLTVRDLKEIEWHNVSPPRGEYVRDDEPTALKGSLCEQAYKAGRVLVFSLDESGDAPDALLFRGTDMAACCVIPLITLQGLVGFLLLADPVENAFRPEEVQILERLSASMATAMEHSRLYEQQARFATELERQVLERTKMLQAAQEKLIQTEKLAATGELAANVAHEINNPLSIIKNYVKLLQGQMLASSKSGDLALAREGTNIISEEIDRIARIVSQLNQVYTPESPRIQIVNLNEELKQLIQLFRHTFHEKNLEVETLFDEKLTMVEICSDHFRQILINLLRNAYDATGEGGKILIETIANAPDEGYFTVRVADSGSGIPPQDLKRIFDPFFTTKKEKGSGLGLSVSYGLARNMGGRIDALSPPGGGAEFLIILPVMQEPGTPRELPKTPLVTRQGERIILG